MKKFDCIGFDSSDYWSGYHLPCVQVPVYGVMTKKEIAIELDNELNYTFELFEDIFDDAHEKMYEEYKANLLADGDTIGIDPKYDHELGEDDEPMYLYFSWVNPVTVGYLTFLNP